MDAVVNNVAFALLICVRDVSRSQDTQYQKRIILLLVVDEKEMKIFLKTEKNHPLNPMITPIILKDAS